MKLRITTMLLLSAISGLSTAGEQPAISAPAAGQPEVLPSAEAAAPAPRMLVAINGQPVTDADVFAFNALQGSKVPLNTEQGQMQVLNQLINTALVAQVGNANNLQESPQVAAAIQMATMQILAEVQISNYLAENPVSDEEITAAYNKQFGAEMLTEYKAKHILVADEQSAKDLITALNEGKDFAELAKNNSLDSSKSSGGDLGWVGRGQVVKEFGDAIASQEKGKYSSVPVKTQYGWHIIMVEDHRPYQPPKLEEVKGQFQAEIQQQRLSDYITGLRKIASIEIAGEPAAVATPAPAPAKDTAAAPAAKDNK